MADPVRLYVSAAPDLAVERELLARAVTEIPLDIGWRIVQSVQGDQAVELEAVAAADVHLLLLGADIRAPIGLEWRVALQAGRRPVPFLKEDVLRTPAGLDFVRHLAAQSTWRRFSDLADLRRQVLELLSRHLLGHADRYVLSPREFDRLRDWRSQLAGEQGEVASESQGGAGESSVILSVQRFEPSEGVLIQDQENREGDAND